METEKELVAQALARPWTYAHARLGMKLHPKQADVLKSWFKPHSRTAFRCGNEVGKTSHVAVAAILHHAEMFGGLVVSTAGVQRQVKTQLVPALQAFQGRYPGWRFNDDSIYDDKGRLRYLGFTAANEGNFQGFHNLDGPLGIILDESAAIKDKLIIAAEERCNPTRLLVMGSPLDPAGQFYQICTSLAGFYEQHQLKQTECPWIAPETIQRRIEKYGAEHPIVLSSIFAEFALSAEGALLSLREWEQCIADPPQEKSGQRHVFLDFAAGRARNSVGAALGNRAWIVKSWREKHTPAAIGQFLQTLNTLAKRPPVGIGLKPHEVEGDADGMGIVFVQSLEEAGWPVQHFHGGANPLTNLEYRDRISEVWTEGTIGVRKQEWIIGPPGTRPDDLANRQMNEELKSQIVVRKTKRDMKGRLTIEAKEDMAKRGIPSPDDADALLGAMGPLPYVGKGPSGSSGSREFVEQFAEQEREGQGEHGYGGIPGGCA